MRVSYKRIIILAFKQTPIQVIMILICLFVSSVLPMMELYTFNYIVNSIMESEIKIKTTYIVLYFILSILLPNLFYFLYSYIGTNIRKELDLSLAGNALHKSTTVSATNLETGEGVNNAYRASQTQSNGIVQVFFHLIELFSIGSKFILVLLSLGIAGVAPAMLGCLLAVIMYRIKYKLSEESAQFYWSIQEDNRYCESIYEVLNNRNYAGEIRLFDTYDWIFDNYYTRKVRNNKKESDFTKAIQRKGDRVEWLQVCVLAITMIVYYILSNYSVISAGKAVTYIYASTKIYGMIAQIVDKYNQYVMQRIMMDEYNRLQDKQDEYTDSSSNLSTPIQIDVRDLSYRYLNSNHNALDGVTFDIAAGEKVVLVGENGSGKTTLIRMLLGVDVAQKGEIYYNSIPIKQCLKCLRSHTTFMGQNHFRYDLSLKDNIIISDTQHEINDERIEDAISWAGLDRVVRRLDKHLNTEMMQGNLLSGGEWQRVALARMKYRSKSFIVLDEPNSAVDAEYEVNLYRKLFKLSSGRTMIIVSHRLPICQIADKIIVMKEGKVAEIGTHSELINKEDGIYKLLFESQAKLYCE